MSQFEHKIKQDVIKAESKLSDFSTAHRANIMVQYGVW